MGLLGFFKQTLYLLLSRPFLGCPGEVTENNNDPRIEPCGTPDVTNTLCDASVVYMQRNVAFTLHLGHVTGDMKQRESNETQVFTEIRLT